MRLRTSVRLFVSIVLLSIAFTRAPGSAQRAERIARQAYSPDGQLHTAIITLATTSYGGEESRVEIRDTNDRVVTAKDFSSSDSNHGKVVDTWAATWTPDSQFFVFNASSSGGHQALESPVWFYARSQRRITEVSELINNQPVLYNGDDTFEIVAPHSIKVTI